MASNCKEEEKNCNDIYKGIKGDIGSRLNLEENGLCGTSKYLKGDPGRPKPVIRESKDKTETKDPSNKIRRCNVYYTNKNCKAPKYNAIVVKDCHHNIEIECPEGVDGDIFSIINLDRYNIKVKGCHGYDVDKYGDNISKYERYTYICIEKTWYQYH